MSFPISFRFSFSPALFAAVAAFFLAGCERASEEGEGGAPDTANQVQAGDTRQLTPAEQRIVLDQIMQARARQQAQGLGSGKVTVNGAWNYTGYSYLSPDPDAAIEARLIAVDITVAGHTNHFDIDDIEVVEAGSYMSFGSDPHATPLNLNGELLKEGDFLAAPPKANRWLLIYGYPKNSENLRLFYWGQELTTKPIPIAESGFELPFPPSEPDPVEESPAPRE